METTTLTLFISTFFLVSLTPGMCMLLALSLGMRIGLRRTFPMMIGELVGVMTVSVAAVLGVATLMINSPSLFYILKIVGGCYLIHLGVQMWRNKGDVSEADPITNLDGKSVFFRGLITALANPKGWAFMIALLPPFIDPNRALSPQLTLLVALILVSEFIAMTLYASGGSGLRRLLQRQKVMLINRLSGSLMLGVGVWLMVA